MKIFSDFEGVENIRNAVVTTGSFDGVHVGHRVIIDRINKLAKDSGGQSVLITFHPHPRIVLYPETAGKDLMLINSQKEKIELLRKTGLDNLIIVRFTKEFARTSSVDFVQNILLKKLHAKTIVVGFNHHFGHDREGDFEKLFVLGKELNFNVEEISEQEVEKESVSSTKIRKALLEGNIQRANAYLDYQYMIMGKMKSGSSLLTECGISSKVMIIEEEGKLIPADGIYAISLLEENQYYRGLAVITPAGADNIRSSVDVILPEGPADLSDKDVRVNFHKRLISDLMPATPDKMKEQYVIAKEFLDDLIF